MPEFYVSAFASNVPVKTGYPRGVAAPRRLTHCMTRLKAVEAPTAEDAAVAALGLTAWSNRLPTHHFPRISPVDVLLQAQTKHDEPWFWVLISPRPDHDLPTHFPYRINHV